jgi:alkylation response protein AidB-like acyl-CoA dehydrogenase
MYVPQTDDLRQTLADVAGLDELLAAGVFPDLTADVVDAVLAEAGRFAAEVLAPLNREGDRHGCRLDAATHAVTTAPGWRKAYRAWSEAGWAALPCPAEYGGQGLPILVGLAVQELWNTAASAFGIGTLLTQGATEAIAAHGSEALRRAYLPHMVSGRWTGTMNLTEPQAGSDLAGIRTRAERAGDGSYRLSGTKIFITYGEHDLTDNIVHLVLARLPDAPPGTRGLSLFLVPKFLPDERGEPLRRNDLKCIGLEEKLGIHGSPTCTLRFGDEEGAVGFLVGEENRGLACMFTMMNNARLHVGMQGVAVAERATQQARAFSRERRQGRIGDEVVAIVRHPDVQRMLADMEVRTQAARAICFATARALDLSRHGRSAEERQAEGSLAALLTPVAKAFGTDTGSEVASLGVQVHGGMGYIEETGAAQHLRDARICQIYEGTNGIQAIDLVTRKLTLEGGRTFARWTEGVRRTVACLEAHGETKEVAGEISCALAGLETATDRLTGWLASHDERALAGATPYLRLFGLVAGAEGLARGALAALARNEPAAGDRRLWRARYFARNHLPLASGLVAVVTEGGDTLAEGAPLLVGA